MFNLDERWLEFAQSERQREVLLAYIKHRTGEKAAQALGIHERNVMKSIALIRTRAMMAGFSPDHDAVHPVMPTETLRGRSTLYNSHGLPVQTWVKTRADDEARLAAMAAASDAFREDLPKLKPAPPPKKALNSDLLNLYAITDYHFGMLAWGEECGEDWDTDIAEQTLLDWFAAAIRTSPNAERAIFLQLGDFLHFDGFDAVTPTSRHLLDVDTRFQRVVRVVIRTLRRVISMLLEKHKYLHIIMADANHDPASGIWLREWLASVYSDDPRITVDNSADSYYVYEFGKCMIAAHHGHKVKMTALDKVIVSKFREIYGRCEFHYALTGHLHHERSLETALMLTRQLRTLAAKDAYASRHGFMSGRDAPVITYHREWGQVGEVIIGPAMLGAQ